MTILSTLRAGITEMQRSIEVVSDQDSIRKFVAGSAFLVADLPTNSVDAKAVSGEVPLLLQDTNEVCCICQTTQKGKTLWVAAEDYSEKGKADGKGMKKCLDECKKKCKKHDSQFTGCWKRDQMNSFRKNFKKNEPHWVAKGFKSFKSDKDMC